jgi:hypothetical protein
MSTWSLPFTKTADRYPQIVESALKNRQKQFLIDGEAASADQDLDDDRFGSKATSTRQIGKSVSPPRTFPDWPLRAKSCHSVKSIS